MNRKELLKNSKTIVIKLGTKVILSHDNNINTTKIESLIKDIATFQKKGYKFIIVSSGAVGMGIKALNLQKRPSKISSVQALAAIGQSLLMKKWTKLFAKYNIHTGQILINHDVINDRKRTLHAIDCINSLISDFNAIPIINENDTISTEEIMFGDNDYLSALTASLVSADLLLLYSDINGLYNANPKTNKDAKLINFVETIDESIYDLIEDKENDFSKGGMKSKIDAAKEATTMGCDVIITSGEEFRLKDILKGNEIGTFFKKENKKIGSRKKWIFSNRQIKGSIIVDNGAKNAIVNNHKSLLAKGVIDVDGNFEEGDLVSILDNKKNIFAKGIIYYCSSDVYKIMGKNSNEFKKDVTNYKEEIIDRDNMIILEEK